MSETELDKLLREDEDKKRRQGSSPGGLPFTSNIPGIGSFTGRNHWEGGIKVKYRGQPWEFENNEYLVNNYLQRYRIITKNQHLEAIKTPPNYSR